MKRPNFKKPTFKRPVLPSLRKAPDPLKGLPEVEGIEAETAQEVDALAQGFRDRAKQEEQRFEDATDTGYYCVVVMENRDQVDALIEHLRNMGANIQTDLFVDGREVAKALGVDLPRPGQGGGKPAKVDQTFAKMARKNAS